VAVSPETITFRHLEESDLEMLAEWLRRPHVAEWWAPDEPRPSVAELRGDYIGNTDGTIAYIAYLGEEPIGFVQSYVVSGSGGGWWEEVTDPGVRGIDQFLADGSRLGQGLGSRMVRAFARRLLAQPGVTRIQTDPDPANRRAVRCYEKAGFTAIREIVTPDGPALLMWMDPAQLSRRAERPLGVTT